jgi:ABC-2 type transport system ATP-binding protein
MGAKEANKTGKVVLRTDNLTKHYGDLTAVKDLSLDVYEGEVFGFLGPNGAGKTTSINMMCGLLKPDSGKVFIHGNPINGGDEGIRARVGMCPQDIVLWERLTCLEQLQFVGQMYGMRAGEARERSEYLLDELGLSEKRKQQARKLSGGMQRRLNLLMALVHDPEIVVLDEPEAGLDPQSRVKVREYIQSLARVKTVILTTHNMDEAERVSDRVAIIDHGELLVLDTPEALKKRAGEGDVLEITLADHQGAWQRDEIKRAMANIGVEIHLDAEQGLLVVRAPDIASKLTEILGGLQKLEVGSGDVKLRENSLEDVFIQLTGRRLRE